MLVYVYQPMEVNVYMCKEWGVGRYSLTSSLAKKAMETPRQVIPLEYGRLMTIHIEQTSPTIGWGAPLK